MDKSTTQRQRADKPPAPSIAAELSYSEAQTALELALAQLQSPDLPVEAMTDLYERARSYADRCDQLLNHVEQTVALWDPTEPMAAPAPYEA